MVVLLSLWRPPSAGSLCRVSSLCAPPSHTSPFFLLPCVVGRTLSSVALLPSKAFPLVGAEQWAWARGYLLFRVWRPLQPGPRQVFPSLVVSSGSLFWEPGGSHHHCASFLCPSLCHRCSTPFRGCSSMFLLQRCAPSIPLVGHRIGIRAGYTGLGSRICAEWPAW